MTPLAVFPDVEDALLTLIADLGDAGTFTPSDLKDRLPFHLVYRFAGADDGVTDRATVGIDTFDAKRQTGKPLAEQVRQLVIATPHVVVTDAGPVVIDFARTAEAPHEVPYGDSMVRRWVSSYVVTLRRSLPGLLTESGDVITTEASEPLV